MSSRHSEWAAATCFAATIALALSLPGWLTLDEAVYRWIQFHRSCAIHRLEQWVDPVVRTTLGLLVVLGLWGGGPRREPRRVLLLVIAVGAGAFGCELLKTAIERLRPNSTPAMLSGNSFPSGHTLGVTLVGAVAVRVAWLGDWCRRWIPAVIGLAAAACVIVQGAGRMLAGGHWLSDVVASLFLGVGFALSADLLRRVALHWAAVAVIASVFGYWFFDAHPSARLHLPAAVDERREPLVTVEFGLPQPNARLDGSWKNTGAEPVGPVAWAMSQQVGVVVVRESEEPSVLKMVLRPPVGSGNERVCSTVVVSIDGWTAPPITLQRGWREYRVEPPDGVLRRGENLIRFSLTTDRSRIHGAGDPGLVAFRYLRLYPAI